MSKEIAPAFQFYAAEYLADEHVALMSMEDEGCYIHLMAYCWREGSIPSDPELLARLCKGKTPSSAVQARFDFPCADPTRLMHPRLEVERAKLADYRKNSAKGGRRSAHKRKHKNDLIAQQCTTDSLPSERQVKGNTSSSSSSSISSSNKPPIVPQGTCETGKKFSCVCEKCQASFDEFWGAYPRHEPGRKQAKKSWCKAWSSGMPPVAELLKWITEAELSKQWQDKSAIPHATTWLNQRRWEGSPPPKEDFAPRERPKQKDILDLVIEQEAALG